MVDNSPIQLKREKLNSKNYHQWAQSIKLVIDGKSLSLKHKNSSLIIQQAIKNESSKVP